MKTRIITTLLLLIGLSQLLSAQDRAVERELERLRTSVQRTVSTLQVLPDFFSNDARSQIENKLIEIRESFENAERLVRENRPVQARIAIQVTYAKLREIEAVVRRHPVFRLKFQEYLDRKIQDAELAVGTQGGEEATYMLNNAKSFRQRAYSFAQRDQTYSALEYFRLATYFAEQAIRISKDDDGQRDIRYWTNYYQETEMLLQRAKGMLTGADDNNELESLMRKAERELTEVKQFTEDRNFTAAKKKLTAVNRALYRIIDMLENQPQSEDERMRMDVESIQFALSTAKEREGAERPAVKALLRRGNNLVRKIENHLASGRKRAAERQLFFANQLVVRLNKLLDNAGTADREALIKGQLAATKQDYNELLQRSVMTKPAADLLPLIERNLNVAAKTADEGANVQAAFHLRVANRLVLQANRMLLQGEQKKGSAASAESNLKRLYDLLRRLEATKGDNLKSRVSYENAEELYRIAKTELQEGNYTHSEQLVNMAITILTR